MRYEETKKNPGIKAEKTILHDGEVRLLRALNDNNVAQRERLCIMPLDTAAPAHPARVFTNQCTPSASLCAIFLTL